MNDPVIDPVEGFKAKLQRNRELQRDANEAVAKRKAELSRPLEDRILDYWHSLPEDRQVLRMADLIQKYERPASVIGEALRKAGFIRKRLWSNPEKRPFSRIWVKE